MQGLQLSGLPSSTFGRRVFRAFAGRYGVAIAALSMKIDIASAAWEA
jgi:hypothetical protein